MDRLLSSYRGGGGGIVARTTALSPYSEVIRSWGFVEHRSLFPYQIDRKSKLKRGFLRTRVLGSAVTQALPYVAFFTLYSAFVCLMFSLDVFPHSWETAILSTDPFVGPWTTFIVVVIALFSSVYGAQYEYYQGSVKRYILVLDKLRLAADFLARFLLDRKPDIDKRQPIADFYSGDVLSRRDASAMEMMAESAHLLKAIPYAVKYRFRNGGSDLDPRRLPLPPHLCRELLSYSATWATEPDARGNRVIETLLSMFQKRVSLLTDSQNILLLFNAATTIGGISEQISDIVFYRTVWTYVDRLLDVMGLSLLVFLLYLPFRYWSIFGWWALLWYLLPNVIATATFALLAKRLNPFNSPEESIFSFYDLGRNAHSTAEYIDLSFESV